VNTCVKTPLIVTVFGVALVLGMYGDEASARDEVCVYDEKDWKGDRFCTGESVPNLADEDWNDAIASIEVDEGVEVILYENADYKGRSVRVMEDADHIRHGLDHDVSSLEIVRPGEENHHQSRGDKPHTQYPAGDGWQLQQFCNCNTQKRCYVKKTNAGHEVGECLFDCPQGCKG